MAASSQRSLLEDLDISSEMLALVKTRWKPRTRMYSRSWTTSENLCNRKTNIFFRHRALISSQRRHLINSSQAQRNHQHNKITSTTTTSPAQRNHHYNESTSEHNQRNQITSTTKSPAQQHHQHNNITSTARSPSAAQQRVWSVESRV